MSTRVRVKFGPGIRSFEEVEPGTGSAGSAFSHKPHDARVREKNAEPPSDRFRKRFRMNHKPEHSPSRICGARTRSGDICRMDALPDRLRCRQHGSAGGRPPGTPEHPNSRAARLKGRRQWVERMREAKARGEIELFPGGRRARGLPPLSRDPTIRKAQRILEKAKAMADQEIATVPERPWSERGHAEKLDLETGQALDIAAKILRDGTQMLERDGIEGADIKLVTLVKDTALQVISTQLRVDHAKLAASVLAPDGLNEEQRRQRARELIRQAFAERPSRDNGVVTEHEPDDSGP